METTERKYLGMDKNVCFGLGYLIPLVLLILLITDKDLTIEEQQLSLSGILAPLISSVIWIYPIAVLIAIIKYFSGDFEFKCWGAHQLACLFIK